MFKAYICNILVCSKNVKIQLYIFKCLSDIRGENEGGKSLKIHYAHTCVKNLIHLCLSWKCVSSSDKETGHPGQRKVQREVTCQKITREMFSLQLISMCKYN